MQWSRRATMTGSLAWAAGVMTPSRLLAARFAPASPWNSPPGGLRSPAQGIAGLYAGLSSWVADGGWSVPVWTAKASDPLCSVLFCDNWSMVASGQWRRSGNSAAIEQQILAAAKPTFPFPGNPFSSCSTTSWVLPGNYRKLVNPASPPMKVRLPRQAVPASQADGHLVVWQPNGMGFECYAGIRLGTGQLVCLTYIMSDPKARGDYRQNGKTASMLPCYAGLVMGSESRAGAINHALRIAVPASLLKAAWVDPAGSFDRDAAASYRGSLPMGARLALPAWVNPDAIPGVTSRAGKMFARTMKSHGAIIVDRGGEGGLTIGCDGRMSDPALTSYSYPLELELERIFDLVETAA